MYCSNCGKKINETDEICPYCKSEQESEEEIIEEEKKEVELIERTNKNADKALETGFVFFIIMICINLFILIDLLIFKDGIITNEIVIISIIGITIWIIGDMFFLFSKIRYNLSLKAILLNGIYGCLILLPIVIPILSILSKCS